MKQVLRRTYRRFFPRRASPPEPIMFRIYLFEELLARVNQAGYFAGKRILEIGPRDGLDSKRLASLQPAGLVMIELPSKRERVATWLADIRCPHQFIEGNFMYLSAEEYTSLGKFDLIWCTGVLYHNPEQLRFLRKLYRLLNIQGYLVLESATVRTRSLRSGPYVEVFYPQTYRDTGTVTHLPSATAIKAWLQMVGFRDIRDSSCYERENKKLAGTRYACICQKTSDEDGDVYYGKAGLNPAYRFGDST